MTDHDSALLTKVEAARLLGVSTSTVFRLVRACRLTEVRLAEGMAPRLRREDVLELTRVAGLATR